MTWVETLVPLGALGVAAFGLWLTFKERIAAHRSTLYDRQLEAYQSIARGLAELHSEIVSSVIGGPIPEENRIALRQLIANSPSSAEAPPTATAVTRSCTLNDLALSASPGTRGEYASRR